ncbi:hypothetical protein HAX54_013027, partial [Datura stramonium]|nr:hypothetical protein [Datura stramonium]
DQRSFLYETAKKQEITTLRNRFKPILHTSIYIRTDVSSPGDPAFVLRMQIEALIVLCSRSSRVQR